MVQTRFKQVLFGANWDIQLHFSFLLTVRPKKIKNQKNKKQKIDFVRKILHYVQCKGCNIELERWTLFSSSVSISMSVSLCVQKFKKMDTDWH